MIIVPLELKKNIEPMINLELSEENEELIDFDVQNDDGDIIKDDDECRLLILKDYEEKAGTNCTVFQALRVNI